MKIELEVEQVQLTNGILRIVATTQLYGDVAKNTLAVSDRLEHALQEHFETPRVSQDAIEP